MLGFTPFASAPFASAGAVDVAVDLTGVQATGQVGTVAVTADVDVPVTGLSATGQVGTVVVTAVTTGANTIWKQTSYNSNFRGTYAGIGYTYDPINDIFVKPVLPLPIPPGAIPLATPPPK